MKISHDDLCQLLGIPPAFETGRWKCRVYAALYRNHFMECLHGWAYLGSIKPADALASALSAIGGTLRTLRTRTFGRK